MENLLPIWELIKKSFEFYVKKMWLMAGITLFGMIGVLILLPFVLIDVAISWIPFSHQEFILNIILLDILFILIGIFFAIIFVLWSKVALVVAVKENLEFKEILKVSWKKMASFFWISLLVGLATLGGMILFVVPGIIFAVWFSLSIYVFIFENLKGTAALKRSKKLVENYWWPVFGRIIVFAIIVILISLVKGVGQIVNVFFTTPFGVVYMYMLYEDLKKIKA